MADRKRPRRDPATSELGSAGLREEKGTGGLLEPRGLKKGPAELDLNLPGTY